MQASQSLSDEKASWERDLCRLHLKEGRELQDLMFGGKGVRRETLFILTKSSLDTGTYKIQVTVLGLTKDKEHCQLVLGITK